MRCPTTDCGQTMEPDSRAGYDAVSGSNTSVVRVVDIAA